jgi:hypothetical protein
LGNRYNKGECVGEKEGEDESEGDSERVRLKEIKRKREDGCLRFREKDEE